MKLYRRLSLPAVVALAFLAVALKAAVAQTPLIIGVEQSIPTLDPHRAATTAILRIVDAVFDPLIREDLSKPSVAPDLKPGLAESWSASADLKKYTFKIRSGVTFHDGEPLTAAAVKLNFDRIMDKSSKFYDAKAAANTSAVSVWIASTEALDDRTFVINLKEPFSGLPRLLTERRVSIISPRGIQQFSGDELSSRAVGTGPFKVASRTDQQINLEVNKNYWGGAPKTDQIIFVTINDPSTMSANLVSGKIDLIWSASPQQVSQVKGNPAFSVTFPDSSNLYFIRLNTRAKPLDDIRFRQALNLAVNRKALAVLLEDLVIPIGGPVSRTNESFDERLTQYGYDPVRAKALVAEMGLKSLPPLKVMVPSGGAGFAQSRDIIAQIQQDMRAVGITLEPQLMDLNTMVAIERPGYQNAEYAGALSSWNSGSDTAYWVERMYGSNQQPPAGANRGWYGNLEVDALLSKVRSEVDLAKQKELMSKAVDIVTKDAPYIWLYQDRSARIASKAIEGLSPGASIFFDYISIAKRKM